MTPAAYIRLAIYIGALLAVIGIIYGVHRWDTNRLAAEYDRGVQDERRAWTDKVAAHNVTQAAENTASTRDSEQAADTARAAAGDSLASNAAVAEKATQDITNAHAQANTPVCNPLPGGRARPLPAGVLDALATARRSATDG